MARDADAAVYDACADVVMDGAPRDIDTVPCGPDCDIVTDNVTVAPHTRTDSVNEARDEIVCVSMGVTASDLVLDSSDGECEEKLCVLVTAPECGAVEVSVAVAEIEAVSDWENEPDCEREMEAVTESERICEPNERESDV